MILVQTIQNQIPIAPPPPQEMILSDVKVGSHGASSNYVYLQFKFKHAGREYVNGTFLSAAERTIIEGIDEVAKDGLIKGLMQKEWEASYRVELSETIVKNKEIAYKQIHLKNKMGKAF